MQLLSFGNPENPKLLLIHGFQSPATVFLPYVRHYRERFCVLVPILPGHDPDAPSEFTTFSQAAQELAEQIRSRFGSCLYGVYAMSMGGVLAATLWQEGTLTIQRLILDGTPLTGLPGFAREGMLRFYRTVTEKARQNDPQTLRQARAICPEACMPEFLRLVRHMSEKTITGCIQGLAAFRLKKGLTPPAQGLWFFHGTAPNELFAWLSARRLKAWYHCQVTVFRGKGHCENALLHPEELLPCLDRILLPEGRGE